MSPLWGLHEEQHGEEPEHPAPRGAHRSEPRAGALARATAAAADPAATRGGAVRLLQPLRRPAAAGGPGALRRDEGDADRGRGVEPAAAALAGSGGAGGAAPRAAPGWVEGGHG